MDFVEVCKKDEIQEGQAKIIDFNGEQVALFNVNDNIYAIHNTCLHMGGPLGEGSLSENIVTCPWHGWQYDVKTGANKFNPSIKVKNYKVKVSGNKVMIANE